MRTITTDTIVQAVSNACMDAAFYLPIDVKHALQDARNKEVSDLGRWSLDKILDNIDIAANRSMPICQDCGLVVVFAEVGQDLHIKGGTLEVAIQNGVAQGYKQAYLRKSIVSDPLFERVNTRTNTPCIIHYSLAAGNSLTLDILPKGGGSENMSSLGMLKPAEGPEGVIEFVSNAVINAQGNPCPPSIVGVGIGGNAEKALELSKKALRREIGVPHENKHYAQLEQAILERINKSGVGPQGFGGSITALAVHIETFSTHIAMLPVGVSLNCHAARHKRVVL